MDEMLWNRMVACKGWEWKDNVIFSYFYLKKVLLYSKGNSVVWTLLYFYSSFPIWVCVVGKYFTFYNEASCDNHNW